MKLQRAKCLTKTQITRQFSNMFFLRSNRNANAPRPKAMAKRTLRVQPCRALFDCNVERARQILTRRISAQAREAELARPRKISLALRKICRRLESNCQSSDDR